MKTQLIAIIATGLLAGQMSAQAGTITYDFIGSQNPFATIANVAAGCQATFSGSPSGVDVTVRAAPCANVTDGTTGLNQGVGGLGATGDGGGFRVGGNTVTGGEALIFSWADSVNLLSVSFSTATRVNILGTEYDVALGANDFSFLGLSGSEIGIRYVSGNAFLISGMTIGTTVPEPSTLVLLGLGLAGLGLGRRRKTD